LFKAGQCLYQYRQMCDLLLQLANRDFLLDQIGDYQGFGNNGQKKLSYLYSKL